MRHIHARPVEHIRVHRPRTEKPDYRYPLIGAAIWLCWDGIRDVLGLAGAVIEVTVIILFWAVIIIGVALVGYAVVQAIRAASKKQ